MFRELALTSMMRIETVPAADWPSLAAFVFERNGADGDVRCLHSHAGDDAAAYAAELRALSPEEARYCAAYAGAEIIGVIGAEFDAALGRAWLRGPLVAARQDFQAVAAALLDALCSALPAQVVQHAAFVAADCAEALAFYRGRGFGDEVTNDEYSVWSPAAPIAEAPGVRLVPAEARWRGVIGALHDEVFPGAYVTVEALFEPDGPDRFTRVALAGGEPAGYIRVHFDAQWHGGYVDFLAVAPAARRRGIARALLQAALDWSFGRFGARAVTLTVRDDRHAARALYESAGFARVRTAVGLRRRIG